MNPQTSQIIAIDIAKDSLQVYTAEKQYKQANTPEGLKTLCSNLKSLNNPWVICEATGGYERGLMQALFAKKIPVHLANPARVRAFAGSEGIRAKTDPIDAKVLWLFAREKGPRLRPSNPPPAYILKLSAVLDRRSQLTGELAREKNRLQMAHKAIASSIRKMIKFLERQISQLDQRITRLIENSPKLRKHYRTMLSVCGVGPVTAWTLLAYMPELNTLSRNQAVALAGLAPFAKESGKMHLPRCIQAGRAKVRKILYMAAQTAAQHNPVIKAYVQRLQQHGKPYKCAIVAAMRKLLIHIQALIKNPDFALD